MKGGFNISTNKIRGFLYALILVACVFCLLPLSIYAGRSDAEKTTKQTFKVVSVKNISRSEKHQDKMSGVSKMASPNFGRESRPNFKVNSLVRESFSNFGSGKIDFSTNVSSNFELNNFGGANLVGEELKFEFSQLDKIPRRLNSVSVEYPQSLLQRGIEGYVRLLLTILEDGSVEVEKILSSTNTDFGKSAVEAAAKLKFESPEKNGKKVRAQFELPMPFRILK